MHDKWRLKTFVYGVERYVLGEMMNNAHYEMFNEL
jgi:hypothetical protein